MARQYWVGEFFVDLSRNQISQQSQAQTLPPKALLVLTYLAENRGRVVSYDELLDHVWPDSIVTPNTLQRSIAQLRKALGENSKASNVIKTHAKQGYSLECEVTWFGDNGTVGDTSNNTGSQSDGVLVNSEPAINTAEPDRVSGETAEHNVIAPQSSARPGVSGKLLALASFVVVLLAVVLTNLPKHASPAITFGELRYLTATDDKEFGASYSPDGQYIVFQRYYDRLCINNIWAKDANTLEEFQLTHVRGTYDAHSLSPDGKTLAYIKQEDCSKPVTQDKCYRLMRLDFDAALAGPQQPEELLHCQNSAIKSLVWMDDDHIAMMQNDDRQWRIIRFSVKDKTSKVLYQVENGNVFWFNYSPERKRFAVSVFRDGGRHDIDMLADTGELLSSHPIQIPEDAPKHLWVYPTFSPNQDELFLTFGGLPYSLSVTGNVTRIDFPFADRAGGPYFHPDGDRLLLIKGRYDSDIGVMDLGDTDNASVDGVPLPLSVIERSVELEDLARFQPGGQGIAMISERTSTEQIWLQKGAALSVLSAFPRGTVIRNLHWNRDGTGLLVLADRELYTLNLEGSMQSLDFPDPILNIYHWDSANAQALASILVNGNEKFGFINLSELSFSPINGKRVRWAVKEDSGPIVYLDHLNRFWRQTDIEFTLIDALANQGSSKRFVLKEGVLVGINRDDQLWRYNLETEQFEKIGQVSEKIDYLTDMNENALLVSLLVAEKKEVVELLLE